MDRRRALARLAAVKLEVVRKTWAAWLALYISHHTFSYRAFSPASLRKLVSLACRRYGFEFDKSKDTRQYCYVYMNSLWIHKIPWSSISACDCT